MRERGGAPSRARVIVRVLSTLGAGLKRERVGSPRRWCALISFVVAAFVTAAFIAVPLLLFFAAVLSLCCCVCAL